ncbi:MAG: hypothetical protein H6732_03630 [Alphaproteobacteria bacterium]|nr:hypothetical protein [Alphaproteobacteria bacterium]
MIVDIAYNPRITEMLGRVEHARRRAAELDERDPARAAAEDEAARLYAELGRYVHWLMRQDPPALSRIDEEARAWAASADARAAAREVAEREEIAEVEPEAFDELDEPTAGSFQVVELTGDSRSMSAVDLRELADEDAGLPELLVEEILPEVVEAEPLALGDLDDDERTDVGPEGADGTEPSAIALGDELPDGDDDDGGEDEDGMAIAVRTGSFEVIEEEGGAPAPTPSEESGSAVEVRVSEDDWLAHLRDLLEVLGGPRDLAEGDGATQASVRTLAQATTNLEVRWSLYPDAVQQALLGLVGARARRLEGLAAGDGDVRLALGRMARFAEDRGLLLVPSLRKRVAQRDWLADERRYWAVLHAGL